MQFVADNADNNIRTFDGSGTFHGLGITAIQTAFPINSIFEGSDWIFRAKDIKSDDLVTNERKTIQKYVHLEKPIFSSVEMKPLFRYSHQIFSLRVM